MTGLVFLLNYCGIAVWGFTVLLVSLLGFQEFRNLCRNIKIHPSDLWVNFFITCFILVPTLVGELKTLSRIFVFQGLLMAVSYIIILLRTICKASQISSPRRFDDLAASMWAVLHLGLFPSFFVWTRTFEHGHAYVVILIWTIGLGDTLAMLFGKYYGQRPLLPMISPSKTLEGSVAGLITSSLTFLVTMKLCKVSLQPYVLNAICTFVFRYSEWSEANLALIETMIILLIGLILGSIGQLGDLLESLFKRETGVKDSGNLLLSHGGILDRIDSHYFAACFAYFIFAYLIT